MQSGVMELGRLVFVDAPWPPAQRLVVRFHRFLEILYNNCNLSDFHSLWELRGAHARVPRNEISVLRFLANFFQIGKFWIVRMINIRWISSLAGRFGMDWGLKNRLSRMIKPSTGRSVMLACDHGYFMGPTHRLEDPRKTIEPLLPYADTVAVTRGVLRNCIDPKWDTPILLRVSGGTSVLHNDLSDEGITTSMREAVRLNVCAVALSVFVGTEHERQTLLNLAKLVDEGEEYGIPVMAITAVGKELEKRDARYLSLACRVSAEIGVHVVKTYYCEDFGKVVNGCPVPIVVAGGPKLNSETDVFQLAYNAVREGAVGVDMGRNIWQNDYPVAMIKAIRAVVQENATLKEASQVFEENKGTHPVVEDEIRA
jgi:3-hydroxy-5-phosphonooxypentane-2,4-dione thiolase